MLEAANATSDAISLALRARTEDRYSRLRRTTASCRSSCEAEEKWYRPGDERLRTSRLCGAESRYNKTSVKKGKEKGGSGRGSG